jgi:hypothetical protein
MKPVFAYDCEVVSVTDDAVRRLGLCVVEFEPRSQLEASCHQHRIALRNLGTENLDINISIIAARSSVSATGSRNNQVQN